MTRATLKFVAAELRVVERDTGRVLRSWPVPELRVVGPGRVDGRRLYVLRGRVRRWCQQHGVELE
jgi:hypothetical protein